MSHPPNAKLPVAVFALLHRAFFRVAAARGCASDLGQPHLALAADLAETRDVLLATNFDLPELALVFVDELARPLDVAELLFEAARRLGVVGLFFFGLVGFLGFLWLGRRWRFLRDGLLRFRRGAFRDLRGHRDLRLRRRAARV